MARQFFEAQLVKHSGSVLVPSMSEDRMNNEFRFVFADKSQSMVLPDPAGEIQLKIEKLIPIEKLDGVQKSICNISVARMVVMDELDDQLMSKNFARTKETCFVTQKNNRVDNIQLFNQSMLVLMKDIARQFGPNVDTEWLKKFGVPDNKISAYVQEITKTRDELLQSYQ